MLLPSALGFSPHPPVSVYGTGARYAIAAFLATGIHGLRYFNFAPRHAFGLQGDLIPYSYLACTGLFIPRFRCPRVSPLF